MDLSADASKDILNEWVFLEDKLDMTMDFYQVVSSTMASNEDGSKTFTFGFKILKEGEGVISFAEGDVSKIDDAVAAYKK